MEGFSFAKLQKRVRLRSFVVQRCTCTLSSIFVSAYVSLLQPAHLLIRAHAAYRIDVYNVCGTMAVVESLMMTSSTETYDSDGDSVPYTLQDASSEENGVEVGLKTDKVTQSEVSPIAAATISAEPRGLKVLFLSCDTGGGHRASAESLAKQFELLFPGSTYQLLDLASEAYLPPYNQIVSHYKHLSAHPSQWKILYSVTNSRFMERAVDMNLKVNALLCERATRKKIKSYEPDVVVSVHPLMTSVPMISCTKISHETGKHLPMFTVVTDLGSCHSTWFASGVEKIFVGSQQIYNLARKRGKVPEDKLVLIGLPIRHDFAVEAENLGDRMSPEGKAYQQEVRQKLGLPAVDRKTLLVMGGGEGVGSLSSIVNSLYVEFVKQGIDAVIMVVCGRNEKLKKALEERDWNALLEKSRSSKKKKSRGMIFSTSMFSDTGMFGESTSSCGEVAMATGCIEGSTLPNSLRRILSSGTLLGSSDSAFLIPTSFNDNEEEKKAEEGALVIKKPEEGALLQKKSDDDDTSQRKKAFAFKSNSMGAIHFNNTPLLCDDVDETKDLETASTGALPSASSGEEIGRSPGKVSVVGLGFVTNMAEYMVAADVLVSKAGPGTISEATALSLPVMLTSFLPGQEEHNVDYVVDGGFGAFCQDSDPDSVAEEVASWLTEEDKLVKLSMAAKAKGAPFAARDIVKQIGDSTLKWMELNETHANPEYKKPAEQETC